MSTEGMPHPQSMIRLFTSYIPTRVIYVAAKLGVVDLIDDDGTSVQVLAEKLDAHHGALYRVLRALAGLGILHEGENDRFSVTPLGETLRKDSPDSVRDYAILMHEFVFEGFENIIECVRTGEPVIGDFFEYLRQNPDQASIYHAGMSSQGRIEASAIIEAYDFSKCGTIVDVGGGNGAFLSSILARYHQISAVLFDQASALDAAKSERVGSLPRCELIAGDFFEGVPSGRNTYILKRVLFSFSDEAAIQILENCRQAMVDSGRVLIIEPMIGGANEQTPALSYDMTFLVWLTGRVRTEEENAALLSQAGLRLKNVVSTKSDVSILEAFDE